MLLACAIRHGADGTLFIVGDDNAQVAEVVDLGGSLSVACYDRGGETVAPVVYTGVTALVGRFAGGDDDFNFTTRPDVKDGLPFVDASLGPGNDSAGLVYVANFLDGSVTQFNVSLDGGGGVNTIDADLAVPADTTRTVSGNLEIRNAADARLRVNGALDLTAEVRVEQVGLNDLPDDPEFADADFAYGGGSSFFHIVGSDSRDEVRVQLGDTDFENLSIEVDTKGGGDEVKYDLRASNDLKDLNVYTNVGEDFDKVDALVDFPPARDFVGGHVRLQVDSLGGGDDIRVRATNTPLGDVASHFVSPVGTATAELASRLLDLTGSSVQGGPSNGPTAASVESLRDASGTELNVNAINPQTGAAIKIKAKVSASSQGSGMVELVSPDGTQLRVTESTDRDGGRQTRLETATPAGEIALQIAEPSRAGLDSLARVEMTGLGGASTAPHASVEYVGTEGPDVARVQGTGRNPFTGLAIQIDTRGGDDDVGVAIEDMILNGDANVSIEGGGGDDAVEASLWDLTLDGANVNFMADMGDGQSGSEKPKEIVVVGSKVKEAIRQSSLQFDLIGARSTRFELETGSEQQPATVQVHAADFAGDIGVGAQMAGKRMTKAQVIAEIPPAGSRNDSPAPDLSVEVNGAEAWDLSFKSPDAAITVDASGQHGYPGFGTFVVRNKKARTHATGFGNVELMSETAGQTHGGHRTVRAHDFIIMIFQRLHLTIDHDTGPDGSDAGVGVVGVVTASDQSNSTGRESQFRLQASEEQVAMSVSNATIPDKLALSGVGSATRDTSVEMVLNNVDVEGQLEVDLRGFRDVRRNMDRMRIGGVYQETIHAANDRDGRQRGFGFVESTAANVEVLPGARFSSEVHGPGGKFVRKNGSIILHDNAHFAETIDASGGLTAASRDQPHQGMNLQDLLRDLQIGPQASFESGTIGTPHDDRLVQRFENIQIRGGTMQTLADTGDGNDTATIVFVGGWGSSSYQYAFEGTYNMGAGADRLSLVAGDVVVPTGASFDLRVDGEEGRDTIWADIEATIGGSYRFLASGGRGGDVIGAVHKLEPARPQRSDAIAAAAPAIDILIAGEEGNDQLAVWLFAPGIDEDLIRALTNGGPGIDACRGNVKAVNCEL